MPPTSPTHSTKVTDATKVSGPATPPPPNVATDPSALRPRRSLRVPRRACLGDPPLLRRVDQELAYTPTRCRVTASLLVARVNPWWQRLPSGSVEAPDMQDAPHTPSKHKRADRRSGSAR
ncbi:hypothetical protein PAN31108_00243 [Pandoraea anhela]|uniref:Uncharacterized protein n=1 Tax=Pandoraea anhela TaxID=2508295 RepID=A0A5E4RK20_9BURK|nr:hypothetical protein PAN31108_00243 [Pandoraea anhela]